MDTLKKIYKFIDKHHVMSLATSNCDEISVCNLFYAYDKITNSFIVASSLDTDHIKNVLKNKNVAGSVVLETKIVGKIQGLQFKGEFLKLEDENLKAIYFDEFAYAVALNPLLWQIKINYFKYTDNTFGFGKKFIWQRD